MMNFRAGSIWPMLESTFVENSSTGIEIFMKQNVNLRKN